MAQIDPVALIQAYIPFAKSSQSLDFEKQSIMRPTAKNCTVLNSSTSNSEQSTSRTCEVEGERYEIISSGTISNHVPSSYDSTGLRMIQTNYRDSSSSPRSPSARSAKRLKMNSSSALSLRNSSINSTINPLSVAINSTNQSPKSHTVADAQHKSTGKHLNIVDSIQTNDGATKLSKYFARDILHGTNSFRRPNSSPVRINSHLNFENQNGYDNNKPSTSKCFTSGSKQVLNGAVKRRIDVNASHTSTRKMESQGNRTLNGKEEKRLISENSELETRFLVNNRVIFYSTWEGSRVMNPDGRNVGVGLCNYSNDCFLNAVLQIILHCIPFARYLGEHIPLFSCVKDCVACGLAKFIRCSMSSKQPFKPSWINFILEKAFPSHLLGAQEDAHEALNHILDALDSEARNGTSSSNRNFANPLNGPRFLTPVEQLFVGTLRNQIQCSACSAILINYERFRELNLGIKKSSYDRRITLEDLLDDYFGSEVLNNFKCTNCKRTTQIQRSSRILRAPNILLIQLKRFNSFGGKIGVHVNFSLKLDLDRYVHRAGESHNYELTGIVQHMGNAVEHGHYVAVVRGFDGRSYYLFDDEQRHRISLSDLHSTQAYILLYVRGDAFRNSVSPSATLNAANDTQNETPTRNRMMKRPYLQISMDT